MTIFALIEKVQKAEEAVAKIKKTIERHEAQAEKKLKIVLDHGWNPEDPFCRYGTEEHFEAYWAITDYTDKLEDIKSATKKLAEKEQTLQNWKDRLEAAKKQAMFLTEVPDCMKTMIKELTDLWDEWDLEKKAKIREAYKTMTFEEFRKKYGWNNPLLDMTAEQIHAENVREAESLIIDLYYRINAITGEVVDWSGIRYGGKALNGVVHGKLGSVRVESILAGGYNIQRLHVRVLVHEIKK